MALFMHREVEEKIRKSLGDDDILCTSAAAEDKCFNEIQLKRDIKIVSLTLSNQSSKESSRKRPTYCHYMGAFWSFKQKMRPSLPEQPDWDASFIWSSSVVVSGLGTSGWGSGISVLVVIFWSGRNRQKQLMVKKKVPSAVFAAGAGAWFLLWKKSKQTVKSTSELQPDVPRPETTTSWK